MNSAVPRFTIQDNKEFIDWLSTYQGPYESMEVVVEDDEPSKLY